MKAFACAVTVLALIAGCGQTALQRAKVAGLTAKQTAETAYVTVRVEYLLGHVDESTMTRAAQLYARFERAQDAYVRALQLWEGGAAPADLNVLQVELAAIAADLHAVAETARPPATSQPIGR